MTEQPIEIPEVRATIDNAQRHFDRRGCRSVAKSKGVIPRPHRVRWHEITCPICLTTVRLTGTEYNFRRLKTCGDPTCSNALHLSRDTAAAKTVRLNAMAEMRLVGHTTSPLSGAFETNVSAKEWHLMSPDGNAYHFRNLALWLRQHADLFDPDDVAEVRSASKVITRAQSKLGRLRPERAKPRRSWKGWRWLHATADDIAEPSDKTLPPR